MTLVIRAGAAALRRFIARADELGDDPTSSVLSRLITQVGDPRRNFREFVDAYETSPEAA